MARIKADSVKGFTKRTWDTAYSRSIKSTTVSGDTNKVISLNQQNGESILIEGVTDTNYYVTSGSLSQGTLTLTLNGLTDGVDITGFVYNLADINNVASTAPTDGQVLAWDNTNSQWAPATNSDDNDFLTNASINNDTAQVTFSVGSQSDVGLSLSAFKKAASTITVVTANSNFTGNLSALGDNNDNHVQRALEILDDIDGLTNLTDHSENIIIGTTDKVILKDNSDGYGLVELGSLPASFFDFSEVTFDIGGDENTRGWTLIGNGGVSLAPNNTTNWYTDYGSDYAMLVVTGNVKAQNGGNITDARFIGNLEGDVEGDLIISDTQGVVTNRVNAGTTTNVILFNESVNGQNDTVTVSASTYTGFAGSTPEFVGTFQGNLKGQVFNPDGSVLALYTASGSSATPILQGDISGDIITSTQSGSGLSKVLTKGTTIFDSSEVAFTTDLNIGTPVFDSGLGQNIITTNFDIDLGVTSQIYFGRHIEDGQGVSQEEYIDASKISTWDSSVITTLYYDLVNYDNQTQLGDIQLRLVKNNDPNDYVTTSNNITGGTYIDISFTEGQGESNGPDSNDPITLDVNTTALDLRYVNVDGDTMSGMLQFSGANGVAGDIYADNLQTRLLNNGTSSGSTYNDDAWFKGDIRGGDLQDTDGNDLFAFTQDTDDTTRDIATLSADLDMTGSYTNEDSNTAYRDILLNQASLIKFGNQGSADIDGTSVGNWNAAYNNFVRDFDFTEDGNTDQFRLIITRGEGVSDHTTSNIIAIGDNLVGSATNGLLTISADTSATGLATKDDLGESETLIGISLDGTNVTRAAAVGQFYFIQGNNTTFSYDSGGFSVGQANYPALTISTPEASTIVKGVVQLATVGQAQDLSNNNTSDNVVTLETLDAALVAEATTPSLQQVLDSSATGNISTTEIQLVSNTTDNSDVSTHGVLLARRNEATGNHLIATFDTLGSTGHIRIGSDGSGSDDDGTVDYGYLGMSGSGNLFLSNNSSTSRAILIDGSDNVGIGDIDNAYKFNVDGTARISSTLRVEALTRLQQGVNISNGAFQVANTTGNTTITGNLDVDGDTTLDATTIDQSLTVIATSSLEGDVTLKADLLADSTANQRVIGTSASKFHQIHTSTIFATTLNNTLTSNLADKGTANNQEFTATVIAPDFQLTSDERLKENIIDLKPRKINVDFKEYNFKDTKQTRFGVVAQEVEKHHPEFIKESDSGYKSVSYIDLLVAKIVELEDRIKQLENA